MLKNAKYSSRGAQIADRRSGVRVPTRSLAYIELDENNGGLILNLSEGGVSVQSAEPIAGERFAQMRFQLPQSEKWVEAGGKIVWVAKSRKEAGIEFLDLTNEAREQIRNWVYAAVFAGGLPAGAGAGKKAEEEKYDSKEAPTQPLASDIDSMFPSEKSLGREAVAGARLGRRVSEPPAMSGSHTHEAEHPIDFSSDADVGIAPGPVKRPPPPEAQVAAAHGKWKSATWYGGARGSAVRRPAPDGESPSSRQESTGRDSAPAIAAHTAPEEAGKVGAESAAVAGAKRGRDPFASIVADREAAEAAPRAWAPFSGERFDGARAVASELRSHFRMGYNPTPFEEPSGKSWLVVGAILLVLLAGGTVLAMGPANVKSIVWHYFSLSLSSLQASPPPAPANATQKSQSAESDLDVPIPPIETQPLENSQAKPNSATPPPAPRSEASRTSNAAEKGGSVRENGKSEQPVNPQVSSAPVADPGQARAPDANTLETPEEAAAITRRFQMEHSGSSFASPSPGSTGSSLPYSSAVRQAPTSSMEDGGGVSQATPPASQAVHTAPSVAAAAVPTSTMAARNERTLDAYPDPAPAVASAPTAASGTAAAAAGTVAISSHFRSLRGESALETMARTGLQIGQLVTMKQPLYPIEAGRAHVEGAVQLRATVDQAGRVEIVQAVSGPPMLIAPAVEAVREWRYKPTTINGTALESVEDVTVVFRLSNAASLSR